MTISIDGQKSAVPAVDIGRGSPQGSVLGCLLYCVTTQTLTAGLGNPEGGRGLDAFLYVDDTTLFDAIPMSSAIRHISTGRTQEELRATELGSAFDELDRRATDRGMRINAKKTQLLAISPGNGCDTVASMVARGGQAIESVQRLKLVGFTFGPDPGVGAHVETIEDAYRRKKWMLFNLREASFKGASLFKLYCCYVRLIIEYCSPVFHPMLNVGLSQRLERLQGHAVWICFGCDCPAEETMAEWAIETLEARRTRRFDSFIRKLAANPRFAPAWFPMRLPDVHGLRNRRGIVETTAGTTRLFNSPLACMRRRANDLGIIPALP